MTDAFEMREMRLEDYDELVVFWKGKEGVELNESDEREEMGRYLVRNEGLSLVVREEGRIVGAILCGHDGRRGYLHHLAVEVGYRGKGIAGAGGEVPFKFKRDRGAAVECVLLCGECEGEGILGEDGISGGGIFAPPATADWELGMDAG